VLRAEAYRRTEPLTPTVEPKASQSPPWLEVEQCLSRLPETLRKVIVLFYLQDRSIADVAEILDLPEGTVKSHLHRARRALGEMME